MQDETLSVESGPTPRPYTTFRVLVNKGKREVRDKVNAQIVARQGEHEEDVRIDWTDKQGIPYVWAGPEGLEQYTNKPGWRVIGHGDFDSWFSSGRFNPNTPKYKEMLQLYHMVRGLTGEYNTNRQLQSKVDELMQKLAAFEGKDGGAEIQESKSAQSDNRKIQRERS